MTATDPQNEQIRYLIDWDADGQVDQTMPPSGYIASGAPQSASRTYAMPGTKVMRVKAEDDGGGTSGWAELSFTCTDAPDAPSEEEEQPNSCPLGYILQNNTCVFHACPSGLVLREGQCIAIITQCSDGFVCRGSDLYARSPQCFETFRQSCMLGCAGSACILPPAGTGLIKAAPTLLRAGDATKVSWVSNGMTACSVSENDPVITDGSNELSGSFTSSPIRQQTTYTLSCTIVGGGVFTQSASVSIIPIFREK
jgi:hypothetical protein